MQIQLFMYQIARYFLIICVLWHFNPSSGQAAETHFWNLYKNSTLNFGNPAPSEPLPAEGLRLFVWNIHKAEDARMAQDFGDLSYGADIALFQECVSNRGVTHKISVANPSLEWTMAKAFMQLDLSYTGVATGARVRPLNEEVIFSNVTEPITETPKTILLSQFSIENTAETLLVANVHGINFVSLESFKVQIRQLLEKIRQHPGPLIVAGDFNTWDSDRMAYLQKSFASLRLRHVQTPVAGILDLDHIFVRDMTARFIFDLSHIDSSDHAPLMVDFIYETNKVMIYEN